MLKVDKANEKISLGLKQVEPDPWLTLDEKYPIGMRVQGKVRNLTNFGAFVELEEGIDGLVHVSDMSWTKRVAHPSEVLKKGDTVEVVVLSIDKEHRRISLGLKQVQRGSVAVRWPSKFPSGMELARHRQPPVRPRRDRGRGRGHRGLRAAVAARHRRPQAPERRLRGRRGRSP